MPIAIVLDSYSFTCDNFIDIFNNFLARIIITSGINIANYKCGS